MKQGSDHRWPPPRADGSFLEVKADFSRHRTRRYIVRSAERGQEVVECILVREVDDRYTSAPLVAVPVEQVVISDRKIEEVSFLDARRVRIVVLRIRCRHF
jgi:hypothetical protein